MKKLLIVLIHLFIIVSCTEKPPQRTSFFQVDKIKEKSCKLSELIHDVEYIVLETNDSCLLDGQNKYIVYDSVVYASTNKEILKFNKQGEFIGKLSRFGGGPEDYMAINDFEIIKRNGVTELLVGHQKGISRYSAETCDYLGIIRTEQTPLQFKYLSDETIILSTPGKYSFWICDITGKCRNGFLANDPANLVHYLLQFIEVDNKLLYFLAGTEDGVTYNQSTDKLELVLHTSGIDNILTRADNRHYMEEYGYLNQPQMIGKNFTQVISARKRDDVTLLFLRSPNEEKMLYRRGNTNTWDSYTIHPYSSIENDLLPGASLRFLITLVSCDADNSFVQCIPSSELEGKTIKGRCISGEDNPVIMLYKM